MRKRLYLLSLAPFWARGTLVEAPGKTLFAWPWRAVVTQEGAGFIWTGQDAERRWDSLAPELRAPILRDMLVGTFEQGPQRVKLTMLQSGEEGVVKLALSTQGRLAASSVEGPINIWNHSLGAISGTIHDIPTEFSWDPSGNRLAVSYALKDAGERVKIYNDLGAEISTLPVPHGTGVSLAWVSPTHLALGILDGGVRIFNTETNQMEREISPGPLLEGPLAWDGKKNRLAHMTQRPSLPFQPRPATIGIYDIQNNSEKTITFPLDRDILFLKWSKRAPSGDELEIGLSDGTIFDLNVATEGKKERFKLPLSWCSSMAKSSEVRIAAGFSQGKIKVWTDYGDTLRTYFARDIAQLMRDHKLSFEQAFAQMLMTLFFFELKKRREPLKVADVAKEINKRSGKDITSGEELTHIIGTLPPHIQVELRKFFDISK